MCRLRNTSREKRRWRRQHWRKPRRFFDVPTLSARPERGALGGKTQSKEELRQRRQRRRRDCVCHPREAKRYNKIMSRRRTCAAGGTPPEKNGEGGVSIGASRAVFRRGGSIRGGNTERDNAKRWRRDRGPPSKENKKRAFSPCWSENALFPRENNLRL